MTVSGEIIKILDDLCRRFGIAIDWTSENVLPYLEDLCARFIQYEIFTSVAWCAIPIVVMVISGILWAISGIVYKRAGGDLAEAIVSISVIAFFSALSIGILIWCVQAFDIIECITIPEKVLLEYVKALIQTSS